MDEQMRKDFEAYMRKRNPCVRLARDGVTGVYRTISVERMFHIWLAATAAALSQPAAADPVKFGCHCDLEPGADPDGCVFDYGEPDDCVYAIQLAHKGKGKTDCTQWKPIVFSAPKATP